MAAEDLGDNPNTLLALRDLRRGVQVARPALEFVAPYQTVCNFLVYFFNPLGTHQSAAVAGGTTERILAKLVDTNQENSLGSTESTKPVDGDPNATPHQQSLHTQYGGPAIDSSGRADCQAGQTGYPNSLSSGDRWNAKHIVGGRRHARPGRAAPSRRASSASTTWRTCRERLQGRHPRPHDVASCSPTSAPRRRTRSRTRTS